MNILRLDFRLRGKDETQQKGEHFMNNYILAGLILLTALACFGCNKTAFPVAQVEGIVLCDGQPVPFVRVSFDPIRTDSVIVGVRAQGITDENGRFALSTYGTNDGAVVGRHEVRVSATQATDRDTPAALSEFTMVMEAEVERGKRNEFTIDVPVRGARERLIIPED